MQHVKIRRQKKLLLFKGQLFYCGFALCGGDFVFEVFQVNGREGASAASVLGTLAAVMSFESFFEVVSPAGV